jgi:HipA-like protein
MTMLTKLSQAWRRLIHGDESRRPAAASSVPTPQKSFDLNLGPMRIGTLDFHEGRWTFAYAEEFKKQTAIRTLVQFPDKEKVYESDELWPFFGMRIPSLKQPSVKEILQREHIDAGSSVDLLRRFGQRTIANPFKLVAH